MCVTSTTSDWPAERLDFRDEVAAADGPEVLLEELAWFGSLNGAAAEFGGTVVSRDADSAWIERAVRREDELPQATVGAPMVERLNAI